MSVRAIDRRFMHMIAYFLVANRKRCNMPLAFFCLAAFSRSGPVTVRCSSIFFLISQCDIICVKISIRKTGLAEHLLLDFGWQLAVTSILTLVLLLHRLKQIAFGSAMKCNDVVTLVTSCKSSVNLIFILEHRQLI